MNKGVYFYIKKRHAAIIISISSFYISYSFLGVSLSGN